MEEIVSANPTSPIHNPFEGNSVVWNQLHSEREDICETLLKEPFALSGTETAVHATADEDATRAASWHRELLQARLRKIDDALDRLMSGSYGDCCKCGKWIEDTKLEFDPAIAFCISCWAREQRHDEQKSLPGVALGTLAPFDTICARTHNSDYRILFLDSGTGRSLVEGGQFQEPVEAVLNGSTSDSSTFRAGWIGVGLRIEFWADGMIIRTSPVQSVRVEHAASTEPALMSMSVVH
jgi:RNA polymerase-binding transcription factor DksA